MSRRVVSLGSAGLFLLMGSTISCGSGEPDSSPKGDAGRPPECCPIDPEPAGCMHLGGSESCGEVCDFYCTENFRIVQDQNGCDMWRYDRREPAEGEDGLCHRIETR